MKLSAPCFQRKVIVFVRKETLVKDLQRLARLDGGAATYGQIR